MSQYSNNNRPRKMNLRLWPVMHIVMGLFFLIVGGVAATMRKFGGQELSATWAYAFGALLMLYGAFRIWRGVTDLRTVEEEE